MRAKGMALLSIVFLLSLVSCSFGKGEEVVVSTPTPEERANELVQDMKGDSYNRSFDQTTVFMQMRGEQTASEVRALTIKNTMELVYSLGKIPSATSTAAAQDGKSAEPVGFQGGIFRGVVCRGEVAFPDPTTLVEVQLLGDDEYAGYAVFDAVKKTQLEDLKRQDEALQFVVVGLPGSASSASGAACSFPTNSSLGLKPLDRLMVMNDLVNNLQKDPDNKIVIDQYVEGYVSSIGAGQMVDSVFYAHFYMPVLPGSLVFALRDGYLTAVGMVTDIIPAQSIVLVAGIEVVFPNSISP